MIHGERAIEQHRLRTIILWNYSIDEIILKPSYGLKRIDLMTSDQTPSLDKQQEYYDTRWPQESPGLNRLELLRLIEIFRCLFDTNINFSKQDIRICDLGCGRGWVTHHLSQFGEVVGIDLSEQGIQDNKKMAKYNIRTIRYYRISNR